ncbi:GNAT family N-acetyltransferase [Mesorhizobium captivum]|uniref:GNAT family N-acetyltransferase n=1 Tax=Mesorhizobium captivum TaxID=3072319 RepID=UPI002A24F049|nr:GNAT family N-acetyltransferase [Mesorhizobium sp. VK23E]MDX8514454.1 GNAT family N-acetyltransferase [Mesorhizobium sp. VK23E]
MQKSLKTLYCIASSCRSPAKILASAYYRIESGKVALIHTEVPSEFSGQGIASRLAQGTFELLRKTGRKAILKCPFMNRFFAKHPEYADVVDG